MSEISNKENQHGVENAIVDCADLLLDLSWKDSEKNRAILSGQISFSTEEYISCQRKWLRKTPIAIEFGFAVAKLHLTLTNLDIKRRLLGTQPQSRVVMEVMETCRSLACSEKEEATHIDLGAEFNPLPTIKARIQHSAKQTRPPGPVTQKTTMYVESDWSVVAGGSSEHPSWKFRMANRSELRCKALEGKTAQVPLAEFRCLNTSCDCQVGAEISVSPKDVVITRAWKMTNGKDAVIQAVLAKEVRDRLIDNRSLVRKVIFLSSLEGERQDVV